MSARKNRNGKIDLLKFIFAIIIVANHSKNIVGSKNSIFLNGSFAVEFFFLVSGYLTMASIKRLSEHPASLGIETRDFLLRKYKSFCPEIILAYILAFSVYALAEKTGLPRMFATTFSEILLINMSGIWATMINGPIWYLSSMLLAMAIFYPLLRKFGNTALYIIFVVSLLLLGWFCGIGTTPRNPLEWTGLTYRGNIRAFAEIGIGICLYPIVEKMKQLNCTVFARVLLTFVEYACYALLIYYMYAQSASRADYFFLLVFAVALIITFSEMGIDAAVFRGRFFWFGKYSFSLYLCHHFFARNVKVFFPDFSNKRLLFIYNICSAVTALFVMLLSDLIRKYGSKLKLKRLVVRN